MFIHADQGQDQLETVLVLVDPEGTLPISFRGLFTGAHGLKHQTVFFLNGMVAGVYGTSGGILLAL